MAAECCKSFCSKVGGILLTYETQKIVTIKNKKVGIFNRVTQLAILGYVIGFAIIWKKGYQEFDTPVSSVTAKLKGTALVNFTSFKSPILEGMHIFDPADYVVPPQQNNAFFVMTNLIVTPDQTRGTCPEDPRFEDNHCKTDANCTAGEAVVNGNGVKNGSCVFPDPSQKAKPGVKVCAIYGWCPVEVDALPMPGHGFKSGVPLLEAAKDFTVLIKNYVSFPKFKFSKRNIVNKNNSKYLKSCHYNNGHDKLCPIFTLDTIIKEAGCDFSEIAYKGGVIGIIITWNCNLDLSEDKCLPEYSFRRLDDPKAPIAAGYNFRFPQYYVQNNKQYRLLYKAYGIRFEVLVKGKAGKFSIVPLFLNLGSGLALLGIATIWCDILVLYVLKRRDQYRTHKYHRVNSDEGVLDSEEESSPEQETSNINGDNPYKKLAEDEWTREDETHR